MCALLGGGGVLWRRGWCVFSHMPDDKPREEGGVLLYSHTTVPQLMLKQMELMEMFCFLFFYGKKRRPSYLTCPCGASAARGKRTVTH